MATITAAMVKALREKTQAGMMDCKKALQETAGDFDQAIDWLRSKGLSAAKKKSSRTAAEGLVAVASSGNKAVAVEVNSETDFVARNENFQNFVRELAVLALNAPLNVDHLMSETMKDGETVESHLTKLVATVGENMQVRRLERLEVTSGTVASYVHNKVAEGLGKIAVLVALEGEKTPELEETGRRIAMHIAAAAPASLSLGDLPAELIEREKAIFAEQAHESGKPEQIIERMIEGRLSKYYEEAVLLEQTYVVDGESKVKDVVRKAGATLTGFVRLQLGEGVEKSAEDFASEVAKVSKV